MFEVIRTNNRAFIRRQRYIRITGTISAFILFIITLLSAFPIVNQKTEAEATSGTATASTTTLTMTTDSENATLAFNSVSTNGTFASSSDSETAKFGVTTNNYSGYTLTITGHDDNKQLVDTYGNSTMDSITTAISSDTFNTATYNNKWGIKPSKYNSETNTSFLPAPTTTSVTLDATNAANNETNNYTIGLGARVDYNTPYGTYANTYTLTAVGNPSPYTISYADNSGDSTVTGSPISPAATTSGNTTDTSITLTTDTPTRDGYNFKSWCLGTVSDEGTTCTGTEYNAGGSFGIDQTTTNVTTLYAVWELSARDLKINFSGSGISSVDVRTASGGGGDLVGTVSTSGGSVSNLIIGDTYYLNPTFTPAASFTGWAKISAEGALSSTTNINPSFTIGNDNGEVTLSTMSLSSAGNLQNLAASSCTTTAKLATDTRDNQQYIIQKLADGNCWMMTNLNLGATTLSTDLTSSNTNLSTTISASTFNSYKKTSGTQTYTAAEYIPVSGTDSTSGTAYGTLYNYCAASAGTICTNSNSGNATYDICPKGWRLPTGGSSGEFQALYDNSSYNSNAKMRAPISSGGAAFARAGLFRNSTPYYQGSEGYYWSSTRNVNTNMHDLNLDTSDVYPAYGSNRYYGYSIRCVLNIPTMQDFTASDAATMATGETTTLKDSRDGQKYTVAKLADGNVWMVDNLNLGATTLSTDLTSSNTNLSTTISASTFNSYKKTSGTSTYTAAEYIPVSGTDSTSGTAYGTLYNYCAASAGTICTNSNSSNATYDICPKGWRLPTGGSSGEFQALYDNSSYNSNAKMRAPISSGGAAFALAGRFSNGTPSSQGSGGYYWSSTRDNNTGMYRLVLNTSSVSPANNDSRYYGYSIRCVLNIPTMQDFTASDAATMATGETTTLKDSRDGQKYTVAKLADGNVWMVDNLNLGATTLSTDLTSSNTNLSTTISASTFNSYKKTSGTATYTAAEYIPVSGTDSTSGTAYGTLYNYCAASAGTICTDSNSSNATYDLCPKGWRLPTGGPSGEFQTLYSNSSYNTNAKLRAPISSGGAAFALAGVFGSTPIYQGEYGDYWSSTRFSNTLMHSLHLDRSSVEPASGNFRNGGSSIRCVLK